MKINNLIPSAKSPVFRPGIGICGIDFASRREPRTLVRGAPQVLGIKRKKIWLLCSLATIILISYSCVIAAPKEWPGVDKTVVEKYAQEHGREARTPLFNTDQGDLLLFVFLLAGTAGGFLAGYCWRMLIKEKSK